MSDNPYVATAVDSTSPTTGSGPLDTLHTLGVAARDGDWIESTVLSGCLAAEAGDLAQDVMAQRSLFGPLVSLGIGWVMEHFDPLSRMLDDLAGDPDAVMALAATWDNVAAGLDTVADDYGSAARVATAGWDGMASDAYGAFAGSRALMVEACSVAATGVGGAMRLGASLVAGVRQLVRETISGVVAWLLERAPALLTGVGVPVVLGDLGMRVASETSRVRGVLDDLVSSFSRLHDDIGGITAALDAVAMTSTVGLGAVRHALTYDDV